MLKPIIAAGLLCLAPAAGAATSGLRDYCPDRPGIGSPACTIDKGHVSLEIGLADWTLDKTAGARNETLIAGDIHARLGLGTSTELQLSWTSYGRERDRDANGAIIRQQRIGDATIGLRQNLRSPDGSGLSIALTPFVTLPIGRQPIGSGDWGAGLTGAATVELNDVIALAFTPEIDAAVNADGHGRHLAYAAVEGLSAKISKAVTATLEYQAQRDRDPSGHATIELAGLSLGWQPDDDMQFDMGANAGLDRNSPDVELYVGVSRRF